MLYILRELAQANERQSEEPAWVCVWGRFESLPGFLKSGGVDSDTQTHRVPESLRCLIDPPFRQSLHHIQR